MLMHTIATASLLIFQGKAKKLNKLKIYVAGCAAEEV